MFARSLFIALTLTLLSASVAAQEVNKRAPLFEVEGAVKPIRLADYKGRVVYVDFWACWCAPCKKSFPWLNEMQEKYGPLGFSVIGISLDVKREDVDKFLAATPAKFVIGFDPQAKIAEVYKPQGMPASYLIGADGVVRAVHTGFKDSDRASREREIQAALAAARR